MIPLSDGAEEQVRRLLSHYGRLGRPEAQQNLLLAIDRAAIEIERGPTLPMNAPRPYPWLGRPGELWIKAGRYWIGYSQAPTLIVLAVFYDAADIPSRR